MIGYVTLCALDEACLIRPRDRVHDRDDPGTKRFNPNREAVRLRLGLDKDKSVLEDKQGWSLITGLLIRRDFDG